MEEENNPNEPQNNNENDNSAINVYEDNAYMFGEDVTPGNSDRKTEEHIENNLINNNEDDNIQLEEDIMDEQMPKTSQPLSDKKDKEKTMEEFKTDENDIEKQKKMAALNMQNINKNYIKLENNNLNNQIIENDNDNEEDNNVNEYGDDDYNSKLEQNSQENMQVNNIEDNIQQNIEQNVGEQMNPEQNLDNNEEQQIEGEEVYEGEEIEDDDIPLLTLKFISICQSCKAQFDNKEHMPYLLKCGHFFCKKCLLENFTTKEGIKCPGDGTLVKNMKELKLLNNLIQNQTYRESNNNNSIENTVENTLEKESKAEIETCNIHKGQRLTHIVEDTKELLCVYCAFQRVKRNPKCEIKEIHDKLEEIERETKC